MGNPPITNTRFVQNQTSDYYFAALVSSPLTVLRKNRSTPVNESGAARGVVVNARQYLNYLWRQGAKSEIVPIFVVANQRKAIPNRDEIGWGIGEERTEIPIYFIK